MSGLTIPSGGLKLSVVPRPSDPYKRDRTAQAAEIELPASITLRKIEELGEDKVQARLAGPNPHVELGSRKIPIDLNLFDNGFLYRLEDGADDLSMKARLDLRMPEKSAMGADSGMLKLMQGLADAKAEKRSTTTAEIGLAEAVPEGKRRRLDPTAHRRGLFGAQRGSRSVTGSPSMPPTRDLLDVPTINVNSEDPLKKAKQEAIRVALVHLVAIREVSKDYIVRTLKCSASDIDQLLSRHCAPGLAPNKYKLNPKAWKLLDPYGFNYSEDDRAIVIEKAIETFDRMRLGPEEKEWQRLLPKEERGKGRCLSRLEKQKEAVQEGRLAAREAKHVQEDASMVDDEVVTQDAADGHGSIAGSRLASPTQSRPGSSGSTSIRPRHDVHDDSHGTFDKRKLDAAKLGPAGRDVKRQKTKADQKVPASLSPKPTATQVKTTTKKPSEKKKSAQPPVKGNFKSAEFITDSDDEEAEAATKVNGISPRPASTNDSHAQTETVKQNKPAAPASKKSELPATSRKPLEKQPARTVDKAAQARNPAVTSKAAAKPPASTTSHSSTPSSALSRPTARPAALDKSKLNAKSVTTPSASPRSHAPGSATMPLKPATVKPLVTKKIMVPVKQSTSSPRITVSRAAGSSASKPTLKEPTKTAAKPATKPVDKTFAAKAPACRDANQKPIPKRDPNVPPKKYEQERKTEPVKKTATGHVKNKTTTSKPATPATKTDKPRSAASQSKPSASSSPSAKPSSESIKAPSMQKTFSHQRKSSSPIKPSPLASSPPISASDMDEARPSAANTSLKRPASSIAHKTASKLARREAPTSQPPTKPAPFNKPASDPDRALKRKASDVDSSSTTNGAASSDTLERPAKRRDIGAASAARSTGASGSSAASKPARAESNNTNSHSSLKAKPDNAERADSHSPSPASSTIGSTSTKGTSSSLLSSTGGQSKEGGGKSKQVERSGGKTIRGFNRDELERAQKFEEEMEKYNKLQREVALMGDAAPVEKIRELHTRFSQLERQKKTFAFIAEGCE